MNTKKKTCPTCAKFVAKACFSKHVISHDWEFKCYYCSLSFTRKDNLCRHLKIHGDDISQTIQPSDIQPSVILPEPSKIPSVFAIDQEKLMANLTEFHVDEVKGHESANSGIYTFIFLQNYWP